MTRYFPAEWHPQSAIQLTWPHPQTDWDWVLPEIQAFYINLINTILEFEDVILSIPEISEKDRIEHQLKKTNFNCYFYRAENNDTWARDHGPISIFKDETLAILDFQFNGWGRKFDAQLDNKITRSLFDQNAYPTSNIETQNFILEGGSIESDGMGSILTTRQCLMNTNRNASLNQSQVESALKEALGCQQVLWVKNGDLEGDDTDAHIDTLARFTPNNQIIFQGCQDPDDSHYLALEKMKFELNLLKNAQGSSYTLVELPWPSAQFDAHTEERLPATYANFLFINGAVLLPVYNVEQDQIAIDTMTQALPGFKIIPIDCSIVIRQFGSLHCLTMQIPTATQVQGQ